MAGEWAMDGWALAGRWPVTGQRPAIHRPAGRRGIVQDCQKVVFELFRL